MSTFARIVLLGLALCAPPALACSLSGDVCHEKVLAVSPRSGASGVPLNAEVKVLVNSMRKAVHFELRRAGGGELVPVEVSEVRDVAVERVERGYGGGSEDRTRSAWTRLVRLRPKERLPADTAFEVRWLESFENPLWRAGFSTGRDVDTEAPAAAEFSAAYVDTLLDEPCSGTSYHGSWTLVGRGLRDDRTPDDGLVFIASFTTQDPDGEARARAVAWAADFPTVGDLGKIGSLATRGPDALGLSVRVVDWAGNESPPSSVALSPGISALRPVRAVRETCGCTSTPWSLGVLALLGLVLRRRRMR